MNLLIAALYFFLPAYFTNMAPPLMGKMGILKCLDIPIDNNKKLGGNPITGSHKTWRGVIGGLIVGMFIVLVQKYLYQFPAIKEISIIDYSSVNIFFFGFLISFGAIFGDLLSAFIKRRIGMASGSRFIPFDQTNYVIGAFILMTPFFRLDPAVWIILFFATFFLHIAIKYLGFLMGLSKTKW